MTDTDRRIAAKQFISDWTGRGDEKQETQAFWMSLLQKVYGVEEPDKAIEFEVPVKLSHTSFIDGFISDTHVLIEQKGKDIDLTKGYKQSDGSMLTPFGQARRYAGYLPYDKRPRWIVVCNFKEFHVHDMNRPNDAPEIIELKNLDKEFHRLLFLVDTKNEDIKKEMEISLKAGELVGVLYDELLKQYKDPTDPNALKSLNALCVRLVFCLYAEDAGVFGRHNMFHDYLKKHKTVNPRGALIELFKILDTKIAERDPYLDEDLLEFPYVNGGLFADENIIIPTLSEDIINLILERASEDFDWSAISPTIFGAVFESTLNPETRRSGGMHYTSIENIHKVIDPLFLNELKEELVDIKEIKTLKTRMEKLDKFHEKLSSLCWLDPACGSGNFLTETYISIRRIENEVIKLKIEAGKGVTTGQLVLGTEGINPIKVSIGQFYGIEINDFAVTVAKTALWIAESQMMKETEDVIHMNLDFLPLKSYVNIIEANALRIDWEDVVPKEKLNYIMGNPPFIGTNYMTEEQRSDMDNVFALEKKRSKLDYVGAWYKKTTEFITGKTIKVAFVSTNSITQGEQVEILWESLLKKIDIIFAYRSFVWNSEASVVAKVHCVIIGFTSIENSDNRKYIFENSNKKTVQNISPYLVDAPNVLISSRTVPINKNISLMCKGSQPTDDGNLLLSREEKDSFLSKYPEMSKYVKLCLGAVEYINNKERYCLWLDGVSPNIFRNNKEIMRRINNVREQRLKSTSKQTREKAEIPHLFTDIRQPKENYLIVPSVSSHRRKYVPIGFMSADVIATNLVLIVPESSIYEFGVITSNVHMAWLRTVGGRLKSDYRYSKDIVYNNFPWPTPTEEQKAKIEKTAQAIIDARALYPDSSLADLYDEVTMPPELRKAHQMNDKAVWEAYGKAWDIKSESECVAHLMRMYQELVNN